MLQPSVTLRRTAALLLGLLPALYGVPAATIPTSPTFSVGATVQNGCLVVGNPGQTTGLVFGQIGFGAFSALSAGLQTAALGPSGGSQALLQCTAGTTVQLSIDGGLHAVGLQRRLANGNGFFVPYALTLTNIGNLPVLPNVPVGIALGATPQALPLQGTVLLPGLGLAAGIYTDTVQVTVSW
ncbi:spore coat protein U domain-containing protein [Xylophilus sp. GOD-11R]|uniref:spore coat protein U domain-containing protein n=1 Tax=Xylophilus sp. GOD-11R TaxID=3089814 RepID=UPI00298CC80E|nr:spore coat protein U domain-containing protein [Xylophilus sp. GOD-11R]WPB56885.1 spore coat protein U domain-containing protein [Xylophilus sp. GOD-11R]